MLLRAGVESGRVRGIFTLGTTYSGGGNEQNLRRTLDLNQLALSI